MSSWEARPREVVGDGVVSSMSHQPPAEATARRRRSRPWHGSGGAASLGTGRCVESHGREYGF
jgi:hypothetical protein